MLESVSVIVVFTDSSVNGNLKQDRHYTYNVTVRRFSSTVITLEEEYVLIDMSMCL